MRIIFAALVFIFSLQSWTKADDIRDFEIEGMSLGDSLLNFYSKSSIDDLEKTIYPASDRFYQIALNTESSEYDDISIILKKNDNKYKIYNIGPVKFFENNLKACKKFMKGKIVEISSIVKNLKKNTYEYKYNIDDKKSIAYITDFTFPDGSSIRTFCIDWSKVTEKKRNFTDNFTLDLGLIEYLDWLNNEAYD